MYVGNYSLFRSLRPRVIFLLPKTSRCKEARVGVKLIGTLPEANARQIGSPFSKSTLAHTKCCPQ